MPLHTALPGPGRFRRQRGHQAAYPGERACSCRQRAGYGCAGGGVQLRCGAAGPETIYQQQRPHIMGNMTPVALLRDSSFFGPAISDIHDAAVPDGGGVPAAAAAPAITEPATGQIRENHVNGHSDWPSATATLNQSRGATPVRRAGPAAPATSTLRRQSSLLGHPRCV